MNIKELKEIAAKLLIFNKNALKAYEPKKDVLDANIKYWLKNKELIQLKKGLYALREKYEKEPKKDLYLEYLAGQMIQPSYLSLEYVLAKYQILSEPARALTSVTVKTTREIINEAGAFRYYSITPKLFSGYSAKYFYGAPIFEADKSKALFDYLYLRFLKDEPINRDAIENLRLNWENISVKEFAQAGSYLKLIKSRRLKDVFAIIKSQYYLYA